MDDRNKLLGYLGGELPCELGQPGDGQIRISGDVSRLTVVTKSGEELPQPEKPAWWIVAGKEPGFVKWTMGEKSNPILFVRRSEAISILGR